MSEPRPICPRCRRPLAVCWCASLPTLPTRTRVVVLQHPRERKVPVGTARMASLCLPNSRLFVGLDLSADEGLRAELQQPDRPAALLFPGPQARDLAVAAPAGPCTLVVVDGTWSQAGKLLRLNPALAALPRFSLSPPPSEYRIRHAPEREYVSTLEALAHALGHLERDPALVESLLGPFRRMVALQLEHTERLQGGRTRHRQRWAGESGVPRIPDALSERLRDLVCVVAEANAWSSRLPGGYPEELVHWLAFRPVTGESLEVLVAPRHPVAPSTPVHTRLTPEALAGGVDAAALLARWEAFRRERDVLCSWGDYGLPLAERLGLALPRERVDLRKVAGDLRQVSPGSMADCAALWGLTASPLGQGRGGERLGQLVALARHLASLPRAAGRPMTGP